MNIGHTEIIFLLDRSGSMRKIRNDMIGGFNTFIEEQKKLPIECKVSFYQFDHNYQSDNQWVETIYESKELRNVPDLTEATFQPRGGTPLLDSFAFVVKRVSERIAAQPEDKRPKKILFVTITDGEENESKSWTTKQICQMIEHQEEVYKWEFVYLGANQNAWAVAEQIGIKASSALSYVASAGGTNAMWKSLSNKTMKYRSSVDVSKGIEFDDEDKKVQVEQGYKI